MTLWGMLHGYAGEARRKCLASQSAGRDGAHCRGKKQWKHSLEGFGTASSLRCSEQKPDRFDLNVPWIA